MGVGGWGEFSITINVHLLANKTVLMSYTLQNIILFLCQTMKATELSLGSEVVRGIRGLLDRYNSDRGVCVFVWEEGGGVIQGAR